MKGNDILQKLSDCTEIVDMASTPARLYILIAHIQLALRHPGNHGASAEVAREIANNMTEAVCHYVPEARALIELGWNPEYDATREYFEAEFAILDYIEKLADD